MERPDAPHRLLGGYGTPVHNVQVEVHGISVVVAFADLLQRAFVQRIYDTAVFAQGRYGTFEPRAEPAWLLPRRFGYHCYGPVPCGKGYLAGRIEEIRRRCVFPGLDYHALDVAVEYGPCGGR